MRPLALLLAASCAATAAEFRLPPEAPALAAAARAQSAAPALPPEAAASLKGFARLFAEGVWGGGRADPRPAGAAPAFRPEAAAALNRGFMALGPAGASGRVKAGFLGLGNGTYRVVANDPYLIQFDMSTNYVSGRFTLRRDAATGADKLGFAGRLKDPSVGEWSDVDSLNDGTVTYDPAADKGTIGWRLRGEAKRDEYHDGRAGSGAMTISLSGNDHEFVRD